MERRTRRRGQSGLPLDAAPDQWHAADRRARRCHGRTARRSPTCLLRPIQQRLGALNVVHIAMKPILQRRRCRRCKARLSRVAVSGTPGWVSAVARRSAPCPRRGVLQEARLRPVRSRWRLRVLATLVLRQPLATLRHQPLRIRRHLPQAPLALLLAQAERRRHGRARSPIALRRRAPMQARRRAVAATRLRASASSRRPRACGRRTAASSSIRTPSVGLARPAATVRRVPGVVSCAITLR